jgi:hypothetical protein
VGDQNGDGCDDLLANHDPYVGRRRFPNSANRVELFYGGEEMNDEPDLFFTSGGESIAMGYDVNYLGNLMPNRGPFIGLECYRTRENNNPYEIILFIYEIGDNIDNEPEFSLRSPYADLSREPYIMLNKGYNTRPTDFNGDGFHDMIAVQNGDTSGRLIVFYGGEDFDTIPDWETTIHASHNSLSSTSYSSGCDLNSDGCDEILISYDTWEGFQPSFRMFLGGDPPDTTPVFEFDCDIFEGETLTEGYSFLPDVNNDGYDDWGIYFYRDSGYTDGYYLYFGGEEPDAEPDVLLEGNYGILTHLGEISGGDFNDDGFGDIVTGLKGGYHNHGEIHLYFGRPELPEEMRADIKFNGEFDLDPDLFYGMGLYLGAVGDYNGDGVDDFVTKIGRYIQSLCIFAGSREWRVNEVSEVQPETFDLILNVSPNPFNRSTTINFSLESQAQVTISIIDVSGRCVDLVKKKAYSSGGHLVSWNAEGLSSGIYFVALKVETGQSSFLKITKTVLIR